MHANAGPERRRARCGQPALRVGVLISVVLRPVRSTLLVQNSRTRRGPLKRERPALPRFTASERVWRLRAICTETVSAIPRFGTRGPPAHPRHSLSFSIELERNAVACTLSWGAVPQRCIVHAPQATIWLTRYGYGRIMDWDALHREPFRLPRSNTLESSNADKLERHAKAMDQRK